MSKKTPSPKKLKSKLLPVKRTAFAAPETYAETSSRQMRAAHAAELNFIRQQEAKIQASKRATFNHLIRVINGWRAQGEALRRIIGNQLNFDFLLPIQSELPVEWGNKVLEYAQARIAIAKKLPEPVKAWDDVPPDLRPLVMRQMDLLALRLLLDGETGAAPPLNPVSAALNKICKMKQDFLKLERNPNIGSVENWSPDLRHSFLSDTQWIVELRERVTRLN